MWKNFVNWFELSAQARPEPVEIPKFEAQPSPWPSRPIAHGPAQPMANTRDSPVLFQYPQRPQPLRPKQPLGSDPLRGRAHPYPRLPQKRHSTVMNSVRLHWSLTFPALQYTNTIQTLHISLPTELCSAHLPLHPFCVLSSTSFWRSFS